MRWLFCLSIMAITIGVGIGFTLVPQSISLASANKPAQPPILQVDKHIQLWIDTLAQDRKFSSWRDKTWRKLPIGPGQHGWVVMIEERDARGKLKSTLGYLVIGAAAEGGFRLLEYGRGGVPLFSEAMLKQVIAWEGPEGEKFSSKAKVERIYELPLQAYWKLSESGVTATIDAKTGIWLPQRESSDPQTSKGGESAPTSEDYPLSNCIAHKTLITTDPELNLEWLDRPATPITQWQNLLPWMRNRQSKLIYVADLYDGEVMMPIGVAGYHWWKSTTPDRTTKERCDRFVILAHEGLRYIRLEPLIAHGKFH
jgi:hypothetical protein